MRTLLIDADIVAYQVAARNETKYDFEDGQAPAIVIDGDKALRDVEEALSGFAATLKAQRTVVCLSDPKKNWRKRLEPTYKLKRKDTPKPALLMAVKDYLFKEYGKAIVPWLEADDVMGILATTPGRADEVVIVSEDKDMRGIPGLVYHPHRPENGVMLISRLDADRFHLWQALVGDPTDGYPGCPGIGKASEYAEDILLLDDPLEMWDCVLEAYASKGLKEPDAILQARLARILRHGDYDRPAGKVRLWDPTFLFH